MDGFETRAIHAGQEPDPLTGAVVPPIYQVSTYAQDGVGGLRGGYEYSRSANPTRTALQECLAALEAPDLPGATGLAFASGLAAEDTLLRTVCRPGDHAVIPDDAYGGTYRLFAKVAAPWGLDYTPAALTDPDAVAAAIVPGRTKLVWVETPTNPLLSIADIAALADVAHAAGAILVVDNTFASPYLQQPLLLGADVVAHSTTKYLGGHSDVVGGALVTADADLADRLTYHQNAMGSVPGPFDSWLVLRGIKTLGVRMDRHSANARAVAEFLSRASGRVPGAVARAARPPRPRRREQADARLRRHGVLPRRGRRAGGRRRVRSHARVHPGRVARGSGVADRAPGPDDARLRGGQPPRGPWRPRAAVGGDRDDRRPADRPGPGAGGIAVPDESHDAPETRGEHRWPMAVAVLTAAILHALLPVELRIQQSPWLPWVASALLGVLIIGDPGRINRVRTWSRVMTDILIGFITLANGYAAVMLVVGIVDNASFETPRELLFAGGAVWITNVIAFALWYWDLDRGGAAERARGTSRPPAFVFPEMQHTTHVRPDWYPTFIDYLAFSFATATAFSPTDVSAVKPWAKVLVVVESLLSLSLATLVIARAINILT